MLGITVGTGILGRDDFIKVTKKIQFNSVSTKHLLSCDKELALRQEENRKMCNPVTSLKDPLALGGGGGGERGQGSKHTKGRTSNCLINH